MCFYRNRTIILTILCVRPFDRLLTYWSFGQPWRNFGEFLFNLKQMACDFVRTFSKIMINKIFTTYYRYMCVYVYLFIYVFMIFDSMLLIRIWNWTFLRKGNVISNTFSGNYKARVTYNSRMSLGIQKVSMYVWGLKRNWETGNANYTKLGYFCIMKM